MPKITILIPVYNVEEYLEECLDSVINQTLADIEIICINDGSLDSSLEILKSYESFDKRIKIIDKENSGYGASMNIGLKEARGEYIGIVESDDFVKKDMFENMYRVAKEKNCDIVKTNYFEYSTKNNTSKLMDMLYKFDKNKLINAFEDSRLLDLQPSIWSSIYKREFLINKKIDFLETKGASYQDTSFAFKAMMCAQNVFLINRAYLFYRQDNINSSVNSKEKVYAIADEFREIERFLDSDLYLKQFFNTQRLITQFKRFEWNVKRIDEKHRFDFIQYFSKTFKESIRKDEIDEKFYQKIPQKKFKLLIEKPEKFQKLLELEMFRENFKQKRKKIISLKLNKKRFSLDVFGKKIIEVG